MNALAERPGRIVRDPFETELVTPEEIAEFEAWLDAAEEANRTPAAVAQRDRMMDDLQASWEASGSWFDEDPPDDPDCQLCGNPMGHEGGDVHHNCAWLENHREDILREIAQNGV